MNLADARVALRPRQLTETFDLGLRWVVVVGGTLYLRLAAVTLLPAALLCYAMRAWLEFEWAVVWLFAVLFAMALQGVFTIASSQLMFAREVRARAVLLQFVRRMPSYLVALFLARLSIIVGLLTVAGLPWLWAHVTFVHEASLLEGHGPGKSFTRAGGLCSQQYGAVILLLCGMGLAYVGLAVAADELGGFVLDASLQLGRPFGALREEGGSLMALLGFFFAVPYVASTRFLHYIDSRTQRDGWDIQLAFLALLDNARREEQD